MIIFSEKKCKIALAGIMLAASLVLLCTRSVYANDNSGKIYLSNDIHSIIKIEFFY